MNVDVELIRKYLHEMMKYKNLYALDEYNKKIIAKNFALINQDKFKTSNLLRTDISIMLDMSNFSRFLISEKNVGIEKVLNIYFTRKKMEQRFGELEGKAWDLKLGQFKEAEDLAHEIANFMNEVKKSNPDFLEAHKLEIGELWGDLMVIKTNGRRGSSRKLTQFELAAQDEELEKLKGKNLDEILGQLSRAADEVKTEKDLAEIYMRFNLLFRASKLYDPAFENRNKELVDNLIIKLSDLQKQFV